MVGCWNFGDGGLSLTLHQWRLLLIQTLVWRCFDRLDLLLITRPQSGHLKGVDNFF